MKYDHLCHLKNSTYPHLYVIMSMVSYIPHNIQKCVYKALLLHICTSSAQSLACPSLAPLGRARSLCAVAPLRLVAPNGRRFPPVRRSLPPEADRRFASRQRRTVGYATSRGLPTAVGIPRDDRISAAHYIQLLGRLDFQKV